MRDILILALTGSLSIAALFRPVLGMLAYFAYTFTAPYSYTWGVARTFPHVQALAVCTIIGYVMSSEKRIPKQREFILLLTLWGFFAISTITAFSPEEAMTYLVHVSKIILMTVLCILVINSKDNLYLLAKVVALSIGLYALKGGLFVILTGGQSTVWGPDGTILSNSNAIGLAMAVNVPLLYYLSREESHKWLRLLMKAMLVFSYLSVVCTFSRGAWLGLAVATGLIIARSKRRLLIIAILCICSVFASSLLMVYLPERVIDRFDALVNYDKDETGTAQERFSSWEFCKRVGFANPFLGAGFDFVSAKVYMRYMPEHVEYWTKKLQSGTNQERVAWSCHNSWLTIWAEHGVPGMVLWLMLLGSCFHSAESLRKFGRTHKEHNWLVSYADMIAAALVVYVITGTFLDAAYYDLLYFLVAAMVIMKDVLRKDLLPQASSSVSLEFGTPQMDQKTSTSLPA